MGLSLIRNLLIAAAFLVPASDPAAGFAQEVVRHGIAMHGEPGLAPDFEHLPYANPKAPRGGRITLALQGTFDSLNPLIVLGVAPDVVPRYVLQSLMMRSTDEPFTIYGLVARTVEMPDDRSSVTFNLDPRARFSDGHPLTAEDVRFSFEALKKYGKPFHRSSFSQVKAVEILDPHRIRFDLSGSNDRELPLLIGMTMPIFPAHATNLETFDRTSLTPPIGSGPYALTEVRPGERVVLTRRKDYWGEDLPVTRGLYNFDEIRYDFYRDANTLFEAFKAGLYDFRIEGDPGQWATGYDIPAIRDGRIVRETLTTRLPKGMNGFVFNTRKPLFADVRVREALGYLFDFDWVNRNLYFGQLTRSDSYFAGSDLAATGRPADERERALLAGFPGAVREDVLEGRWVPPAGDGSGRDREMARRALALLADAGWVLENDVLRRKDTGEPFAFEMLVNSRSQERLALNFSQSLSRIGVQARVRLVDDVQYWRRLARFDFDMVQWLWPGTPSPGNEQRNRWGSAAAQRGGSQNHAGVASPAVDRLIDSLLEAKTREDFVSSVRALDRTLLSGFYVVPLFYVKDQWLAYKSGLRRPDRTPLMGTNIDTWWWQPDASR
ncbi:ABC transporter substrate-binding protein [Microvirga lotononidis]|uniref:ABC-type oligopeptide transport system, periplasmic component n=1 Tax=Microvirga lotononidis TaxID=864069 RepID=I4YY77_9HYPH|nr:ABC transporter substrate-binding protein [Microvirga lotononidis]EIM28919.1 ABC-type oligopeptide transport system, periplasmic component [Microvirga lotononidis]WQO26838.1 ABC transporter substrate-binding protein [Microvirga lotononidis]